jgi:hypothetical protein
VAYFSARMELVGSPETHYQAAQLKVYRVLAKSFGRNSAAVTEILDFELVTWCTHKNFKHETFIDIRRLSRKLFLKVSPVTCQVDFEKDSQINQSFLLHHIRFLPQDFLPKPNVCGICISYDSNSAYGKGSSQVASHRPHQGSVHADRYYSFLSVSFPFFSPMPQSNN